MYGSHHQQPQKHGRNDELDGHALHRGGRDCADAPGILNWEQQGTGPGGQTLAPSTWRNAFAASLRRGRNEEYQMKLSRRQFATTISAAALAATYGRAGWAQQPIVIKFSHVVANDTPKGKGSLKFKELAEKYTNGKVSVGVYPNSTLYKDKEEIEALQLGSVQMLAPSTAKFAPLGAKEFEALDLPWLFRDDATYSNAMKGEVGKWLFKKLESKRILGLAYWDNGFHMVSSNRPLINPADFQGLKIRISGSK